ncbi:oxidoreductase [Exophiala viscosa]|uniref:Oxidoreductase n=1 Tax=Exophiala viscosa TaxID=2486360 RepID=A0AAN6E126_9EURO|nr:oxidoreductase [Exophiala viscosa]KAI1624100.1 oxidoreductase [Exophiala viscosa]
MSKPTNQAAYLVAKNTIPLEVRTAPYTPPGPDEVVIRTHAVAINPVDHIIQHLGNIMYTHLQYPEAILGFDVSGEVVQIGQQVTRFKLGDRVVANAVGTAKNRNLPSHCGFQLYTVLLPRMTSPIPETVPYEKAAVIPLGLSTAACGLFQKDQLALQHPSVPAPKPTGKTVLIWGGSTSVGCNAIQVAVAAGYEVITTCSPRNFAYVKSLGATEAYDYNSRTVVKDIIRAFKGRVTAGALSIGAGAADKCLDVLAGCKGDKVLSMATYPTPATPPKRFVFVQTVVTYLSGLLSLWIKAKRYGVRSAYIFADSLVDNEVGPMIYEQWLPKALAAGTFVAAPEAEVVGHGLENIQRAMDINRKGVSAKKVVVTL